MNIKNTIITIMITFCLTATLFIIIPIRSANNPYDPWIDYNDDGKISLADLVALANSYGTTGTPINKTALLLELQTEIDALNGTVAELQNKNTELENRISILEILHGLPINWTNGLVGYWKLDEGNGTTAGDSSGNNNNGILENGPLWVSGKYGTALNFDGIDDYVAIPDLYSTSPSELTVSAWINSDLTTTLPDGESIIRHCRNGEFGLQLFSSGVIGLLIKVTDGTAFDVRWNASSNEWHQIVGTWKKGDSLKLYVDGILVNQTPVSDEFLFNAHWIDAAIGSDYRSKDFFNGTIDEVMVYNRTLSAEEILAHYPLPPP